jgi:phosphopantothenoylcysteine decarboxylase/phosphopantothenate--cysteine ligase
MLKNKNILIGVTGSIAIYKSLELIRLYIKAGANVRVIMTEAAKKFITPLTFETISQSKVLDDTNESWEKDSLYNHIAIGKWADIFVIAPASVNTINKLNCGIADNILTQSLIAYSRTKLLCPAANTNMIENSITKQSLQNLKESNYKLVDPVSKELACQDIGNGAMSEVEDIYYATLRHLNRSEYWANRRVVLSGGGSVEKIDDVRYISNYSSGKMAAALAKALYLKGADVTLVSTRGHEDLPSAIHIISVQSSGEMYEHLEHALRIARRGKLTLNQELIEKTPYLFMAAAVSDYVPCEPTHGKLKKEHLGQEWSLKLKQNTDVLRALTKKGIISIGFKAEMDDEVALENAKKMLVQKELDAVCLNVINENNPFGANTNDIELILENTNFSFSGDKLDISLNLLTRLEEQFSNDG